LFIGWRQLRRYLLPAPSVKLPPSGASPWSRERPDMPWQQTDHSRTSGGPDMSRQQTATPWQQGRNNSGFTPPVPVVANGYGPQTSVITPAQGTGNGLLAYQTPFPQPGYAGPPPSYTMNAPQILSAVPAAGGFAPSNGSVPPVTDGFPVLPYASGPAVTNGQWTGRPTNATPEVNDPYLLEMIRQSREKGNTSGQPMG
jgi:hypothetical protein